jgi:cellulose synthase/poly-beta-1,6-N-acetylglucosamine synthase-like glycosyltransferase
MAVPSRWAEVVVVDGGSRDDSSLRARQAGARVLEEERGRARQLARGVEASSGEVLLLLHADTCLPPGWPEMLRDALADPAVVGGAFHPPSLTVVSQRLRVFGGVGELG